MYTCIYIYIYIYTHIHIYIYIHTHTYITYMHGCTLTLHRYIERDGTMEWDGMAWHGTPRHGMAWHGKMA